MMENSAEIFKAIIDEVSGGEKYLFTFDIYISTLNNIIFDYCKYLTKNCTLWLYN